MFKISYNANGLRTLPLLEAIRQVAAAGYDGIELSLHPKHLDLWSFGRRQVAELQGALADNGLEACCLATGADHLLSEERFEPSLIHPDDAGRRARIDLIRRSIDLAQQIGVPIVSFASGIRKPEVDVQTAHGYLTEGVRELLEHAGSAVQLAIEPEPDFFVETNVQAATLIDRPGCHRLRINQDIGHVNVCEDDYLHSIEQALTLTEHIHVEDIRQRVHRHEIPGQGDIDFAAFIDILLRHNYRGFISVELYNHADRYAEALPASLSFLQHILEEARQSV